jgi:hypothetical protein
MGANEMAFGFCGSNFLKRPRQNLQSTAAFQHLLLLAGKLQTDKFLQGEQGCNGSLFYIA